MNQIVEYVKKNEEQKTNIHMYAVRDGDNVYGIKIRFPKTLYRCDKKSFEELRVACKRIAMGTLLITSSFYEFRSGVMNMEVAFCNYKYSEKRVVNFLMVFTNEVLPEFKV